MCYNIEKGVYMEQLFFFVVAFFSTTIGAIAGLGGGIIIKPLLTIITELTLTQISFLSAITVFSMALFVTLRNQINGNKPINHATIYLSIGSIFGGYFGSQLFYLLFNTFENVENLQKIQAFGVILMLISILIFKKFNLQINLKQKRSYLLLAGTLMGIVASFLGIGGGPLNMAILMLGFGFGIKDSAMMSTVTIMFAQFVSLVTILINSQFTTNDFKIAVFMVVGAIIGGLVGGNILKKFSSNFINIIFNVVFLFIILLNILIIF